jgi:hypothetical protein
MPMAGFETAIPACDRPQTDDIDRAAIGTGTTDGDRNMNKRGGRKRDMILKSSRDGGQNVTSPKENWKSLNNRNVMCMENGKYKYIAA